MEAVWFCVAALQKPEGIEMHAVKSGLNVLAKPSVVITSQYIHGPYYYAVHLKFIQYVSYTSIKLRGKDRKY